MIDSPIVSEHKNVMAFFRDHVLEAAERQNFNDNENFTFYLVNLLEKFSRSDRFFPPEEEREESFVSFLNLALEAEGPERAERFKRLGDYSLFVSGFFHDSLARSLVDLNYYIVIGRCAYQNLSASLPGNQKRTYSPFFGKLAELFPPLVDILAEVSEKLMICNNKDLLRTYERWLKTGSDRDKAVLKEKGVVPVRFESSLNLN